MQCQCFMAADTPSAGNSAPIAHRHLLQHQKDVLVLVQPSCCCGSRAIDDLRDDDRASGAKSDTVSSQDPRCLPRHVAAVHSQLEDPRQLKYAPRHDVSSSTYQSTTAPPLSRGALGIARYGVLWSIHLPSTTGLDRSSTQLVLELRCSSDLWTFSMANARTIEVNDDILWGRPVAPGRSPASAPLAMADQNVLDHRREKAQSAYDWRTWLRCDRTLR